MRSGCVCRRGTARRCTPRPTTAAGDRPFHLTAGQAGGGPPAFDRETYKQRNTVARCVNRLKQWRGVATRYVKTATIHLAGLHVAGVFLWSAR
jgi:transposase